MSLQTHDEKKIKKKKIEFAIRIYKFIKELHVLSPYKNKEKQLHYKN